MPCPHTKSHNKVQKEQNKRNTNGKWSLSLHSWNVFWHMYIPSVTHPVSLTCWLMLAFSLMQPGALQAKVGRYMTPTFAAKQLPTVSWSRQKSTTHFGQLYSALYHRTLCHSVDHTSQECHKSLKRTKKVIEQASTSRPQPRLPTNLHGLDYSCCLSSTCA